MFISDAPWVRTRIDEASCVAAHSFTDSRLHLQLNHFSWFFCAFLKRCLEGKTISLIPFLPDDPAELKPILHVHLFDNLEGIAKVSSLGNIGNIHLDKY